VTRRLPGCCTTADRLANEARQLFQRLQPTLPLLLANLISVEKCHSPYQPAVRTTAGPLPQGTAAVDGIL